MLNIFESVVSRVKELMGTMSVKQFSNKIGMTQQTVDLYIKGARKPSVEFLYNICSTFGVSADRLLGLDTGGGGGVRVTANGPGAQAAGRDLTVLSPPQSPQPPQPIQTSPSGDCSKCQLLADHIRRITGRG